MQRWRDACGRLRVAQKKKRREIVLDEEDYEIAGVDKRKRLRRVGDGEEHIRAQTAEELERQMFTGDDAGALEDDVQAAQMAAAAQRDADEDDEVSG